MKPAVFRRTQGTTVGPHQYGVPGRHEAEALTDLCECLTRVPPAAVLDEVRGGKTLHRIAAYRCPNCGAGWLCWWAPPRASA